MEKRFVLRLEDNAPGHSTQLFVPVASKSFVKILQMDFVEEIFISAFLIHRAMIVCHRKRIGVVFLLKESVPLNEIQVNVSIVKTFAHQIIFLTRHAVEKLGSAQALIASVLYLILENAILGSIHRNAVEGQSFVQELQVIDVVKILINAWTLTMFAKAFQLVEGIPHVQYRAVQIFALSLPVLKELVIQRMKFVSASMEDVHILSQMIVKIV
jgi:hypothetical protein